MSRNFPLRTAVTGRRSSGGPLYGTADAICDVRGGCSAGFLSSFTAPPLVAERCDGDAMPKVDASRVNQRDELVVGLLSSRGCATDTKASRVSSPAVRHRRDAIRTRKLKKAARRKFFIFIAKDLRRRVTKPLTRLVVRHRMGSFSRNQPGVCLQRARQNFRSQSSPRGELRPQFVCRASGRRPNTRGLFEIRAIKLGGAPSCATTLVGDLHPILLFARWRPPAQDFASLFR
ncbi:MAG: hypothetical protein QOF24_815 [Verrucomicrobiota bacterium]